MMMSPSRLLLFITFLVVALLVVISSSSFAQAQFTPTSAYSNNGLVTITFDPLLTDQNDFIFLYSGASCDTAPVYDGSSETERTPSALVSTTSPETVDVDPALLSSCRYLFFVFCTGPIHTNERIQQQWSRHNHIRSFAH